MFRSPTLQVIDCSYGFTPAASIEECIPVEITQVSEEDLKRLAEEQGLTLAAYAFI